MNNVNKILTSKQQVLHNAGVGERRLLAANGSLEDRTMSIHGGWTSVEDETQSANVIVKAKLLEQIGGQAGLDTYRTLFTKAIMDEKGDTPEGTALRKLLQDDDEVMSIILGVDTAYDYGKLVAEEEVTVDTEKELIGEVDHGKSPLEQKLY